MVQARIQKALQIIKAKAKDEQKSATDYGVVVDMGSTKLNMGIGYSPCLTACKGKSHMDLQTTKKLSIRAMMRFQGFTTEEMAGMGFSLRSDHQFGEMIANAFTKTVIQRIIQSAIKAAEFI